MSHLRLVVGLSVLASCSSPEKRYSRDPDGVTRQVVGTGGGTVEGPGGVRLEVPAGALAADIQLSIEVIDDAPALETAIGVGPVYLLGPEGQAFAEPVSVTVELSPEALPEGATAEQVIVLTAPAGSSAYTSLGGTLLEDATHVTAQTLHFSHFRAAVLPPQACHGEGVEGQACDDVDLCTAGDVCHEGVCAGAPVDCDDHDPCTTDSCDGAGGCSHETNTAACSDGDACTTGDACVNGVCVGAPGVEVCGNGVDEDCDGHDAACGTDCTDADGDGACAEHDCIDSWAAYCEVYGELRLCLGTHNTCTLESCSAIEDMNTCKATSGCYWNTSCLNRACGTTSPCTLVYSTCPPSDGLLPVAGYSPEEIHPSDLGEGNACMDGLDNDCHAGDQACPMP